MKTETITVETRDGSMPVYVARPAQKAARGVLVLQEAFGVNEHIQDVARRFSAAGYLAAAPHVFHRSGGGVVPYGDFAAIQPHVAALSDAGVLADVDATAAFMEAEGLATDAVGVVGFCIGGRLSFLVSAKRSLGAGVTFYGGGIVKGRTPAMPPLMDAIGGMRTPWLGLFGDLDQGIPVEEVETLRAGLGDAPAETLIVRYADAGHGFHCDARPDSYVASAAADGWKRTLAWFDAHLAVA
jgi:carboxymethylenebutenolidase